MDKIRQEHNVNIPNALTLLRILLLPAYARLYLEDNIQGAVTVCAVVLTSDLLDGFIARRWGQITTLGKLLDPLADKLLLLTILVCFGVNGELSWWVIGLMLGKETLMIVGGAYALHKKIVVSALWIGKAATALFSVAVLCKLLGHIWPTPQLGTAADALLYVAVAVTFAALVMYIRNLRRVMRNPETPWQ